MANEIANLQPLTWRGIVVPCERIVTRGSNAVVEHSRPNQDGVPQEPVGSNADVYDADIPFLVSGTRLMPRRYADPIYPFVHRAFIDACRDTSIGTLKHPEIGEVEVVCLTWSSTITGQVRDGAKVSVSWRRHREEDAAAGRPTSLTEAIAAADDLDAAMASLRAKALFTLPPQTFSFDDAVRSIRSITGAAALYSQEAQMKFDRVVHNASLVNSAVVASKDATLNPVRLAVQRLISSLYEVRKTLFVANTIGVFAVNVDVMLSSLARPLKTTVSDLVALNPQLAADLVVRAPNVVRYTKKAA